MTPEPGTEAVEAPRIESSRAGIVWRALLLAAFVVATIPSWISQIGVGLDPSWMIGIHLAGARGLDYGREFAFTYGPLGFALGPKEIGSLNLHAAAIRLGLHLAWWISAGFLLFRVRGVATPLVFIATMAMSGIALDGGFNFAATGAVVLPVLGFLLLAELDRRPVWAIPAAMLAGAAMLMKFNLGVACTASLVVWSLMRLAREPNRRVVGRLALLALVHLGTMTGLFLIYGGPLSALWPFLQSSRELAAGYATQMTASEPGNPGVWASAVMAGLAAAGLIASLAGRSSMAPAFALMLAPMFIFYKGVVVRQSLGHFLAAWPVMVSMTALVLPAASRRLRSRVPATIAVLGILGWGLWHAPTSIRKVAENGPANLASLWRLDQLRADMRAWDARLKTEQPLPSRFLDRIGDSTVDVYPWEVSHVWINDLRWSPRPVFQSYAAYTPALDMMGARHYRGRRAPRFVIYSHYAIDSENACAVDSRTWIELYRWYDLVDRQDDKLLLERRPTPRWSGARTIDETTVGFAAAYDVPAAEDGLVFLKADLELTLAGKLQALVYKVDPPLMRVEYKDGTAANYRMVWRNAAGGFIAGCLPRDLEAAASLFRTGKGDEVVNFSFHDPSGRFKPAVGLSALRSGPIAPAVATAPGEAAATR